MWRNCEEIGYFALISDITSSLFRLSSPQERSSGGGEADTRCERSRCRATIPPVRYRKSKECIQNGPKKPRCKKARSQSTALGARKSAAFGQIVKIEKLRPGEMQRKIVRKMPRLFTPSWTSAAFRHRLSSTSLMGWAVYALSESP